MKSPHGVEPTGVESEAQIVGAKQTSESQDAESLAFRDQMLRAQDAVRRLTADNEKLREELQRRADLIDKKDSSSAGQVRRLEAAENKIRELVRSESEADYKSRTLTAKLSSQAKELEESLAHRKALEKKLHNSQQQFNEANLQVQSQATRLEQLRSVSEQRSLSSDSLEQQNRDLEAKLGRAVGKLELYHGKVQSLGRQIADKDTELVLHQQKLDLALKERDIARQEIDEARGQVKSYRENLTELEQALLSQRRQLSETEESLERAKLTVHRAEKAQKEANLELAESDRRRQDLEIRLEEAGQHRSVLEAELAALEERATAGLEHLQEELEAKTLKILALEQQFDSAGKSHADVVATTDALRQEREAVSRELEEKRVQLDELKGWAEKIKPAFESLKVRYADAQSEVRTQVEVIKDLRTELDESRSTRGDLGERTTQLESKIANLETARRDLLLTKEKLEAEAKGLHESTQADQEAMEELSEECGQLTDQLLEERRTLREVRAELTEAQSRLIAMEAEHKDLTQQLLELKLERDGAQTQQAHLEEQLRGRDERVHHLEQELEIRRRQLSKVVEDLKAQHAQTTKAQHNIKELLRQRTQLLDIKKLLEEQISAGGEANSATIAQLQSLEVENAGLGEHLLEMQELLDIASQEQAVLQERMDEERRLQSIANEEFKKTHAANLAQLEADSVAQLAKLEADSAAQLAKFEADSTARVAKLQAAGAEQLEKLESVLERERQENSKTRTELVAYQEREQELLETIEELQEQLEVLEAAGREGATQEATLRTAINHLEEDLQELQRRHATVLSELEHERSENGKLLHELVQNKSERDELHDESLRVQAQIETLESELRARQEESSYQIQQRVQLDESLEALKKTTEELQARFDRSHKENLGLRAHLEKLQKATRERLDQAKVALATRDQHIHKLREALATKVRQVSMTTAQLERTQLAENALRGALVDLRNILRSREEMVEELEWHLGLVYQTLEDGQADLDERGDELTRARQRVRELSEHLDVSRAEVQRLNETLTTTESERERVQQELVTLESSHATILQELTCDRHQLLHLTDNYERAHQQLAQSQSDLVEEQERSARLGAQLTDALEDRNRGVVRLRDLQKEFQEWRDEERDRGPKETIEVSANLEYAQELVLAKAREAELREQLDVARSQLENNPESANEDLHLEHLQREQVLQQQIEELTLNLIDLQAFQSVSDVAPAGTTQNEEEQPPRSQLIATLEEIRNELEIAKSQYQAEQRTNEDLRSENQQLTSKMLESSEPGIDADKMEATLLRGFDVGSDLVSAQLDFYAAEEEKAVLVAKMESAVDLDALHLLVDELRQAEEHLAARQEEFVRLESEWIVFHNELDETSRILLLKFTGLIEYEMREAQQAVNRADALQEELEISLQRSRQAVVSLEKRLVEKDQTNEELEEELTQLSAQVTDLSDRLAQSQTDEGGGLESVSWNETSKLRDQLKEKSELLELYRRERLTAGRRTSDSIDEQLTLLSERYQRSRERISELLDAIGDRDRRLAELEQDVAATTAFQGELLTGPNFARDAGFVTASHDARHELNDLGEELTKSREELKEKFEVFSALDSEQRAGEILLADKKKEFATAKERGLEAQTQEKLELEVDLLSHDLELREERLNALSDELKGDEEHPTIEDMPAVNADPNFAFAERQDSSEF